MQDEEVRNRDDDLARLVEVLSQAIAQAAVVVDLMRRAVNGVHGVETPAWRRELAIALSWASRDGRPSGRGSARASGRLLSSRDRHSSEVRRALRYIEAHYDEEISIARLARVADCSRRHLADAFRRETGETVHSYLVRVRLLRAAMHVRAGDKVEAVMLGVGFRGKRNFYRQFKAQFGATPCAYRDSGGDREGDRDGGRDGGDADVGDEIDEIDRSDENDGSEGSEDAD